MPNTPALVGEGMTGVCANDLVTEEELQLVLTLLKSFGRAEVVPEYLMDTVTGVSGSSPAYVFLFLEALADAAVAEGMPRNRHMNLLHSLSLEAPKCFSRQECTREN